MRRIVSFLFLLFLPMAALADGRIIPPIALPVHVNIPDQRALICYSNGVERLVIETRFTGAGTNFAWVVPLPSQPVVEEATAGLFPTLQYLFRPQIIFKVPRYYIGILLALGLLYLIWRAAQDVWDAFVIAFVLGLLFVFAAFFFHALTAAKGKGMMSSSLGPVVSILDRKIVGIFETTTITSHDAEALQTWLSENGYAMPTNAASVIADYVKDGWLFVATKVRRDNPALDTSTPHPLSFTFKTDKPVYPVRLTGVDNGPLNIELYMFSSSRAKAAHFKAESCTQLQTSHPLLRQWTAGLPVATRLTATLSPSNTRKDVWFDWTPFVEKKNRLFIRQEALTLALNWGTGFFAVSLFVVWLWTYAGEVQKTGFLRRLGVIAIASTILAGLIYLALPKIKVKLLAGRSYSSWQEQQMALSLIWGDEHWQTLAQARAGLEEAISNPTNAALYYLKNWDNNLVGGRIREEDSPGNYLLRETNNQLQFVSIDGDGGEYILHTWDLPAQQPTR